MRKVINRVCSLTLVLSLLPVYEKQPIAAKIQDESNQVMVTYKSNKEDVKTIEVPSGESTSAYINKLENQPNIVHVEPDYAMNRSATLNDPLYSEQWYHQTIGTEDAWKVTTGSNNIIVAVIDDGIDLHHRDLINQIISPYDVVLNSKSRISIGEGHGTHVSGIIASTMNNGLGGTGIASNVKIMPINVFDGDSALYSDVITGIQYAIDHHADIINLSIGGTESSKMLNDAIQRAYKAGILVVAAAGNDGENVYDYPAAYDHVLAVSATDESDKIADFSNYGRDIDLAAPGTNIYSTLPYNQYDYMSGTSMATPVVAGVAALVWSANSAFTNDQIEAQLYKTADDLGPRGKDIYYGNGRVNASKAVKVMETNQKDTVAVKLIVNSIADNTNIITGTAEAGTTINIQEGSKSLGTAITNSLGKWTFFLDKRQTAGTKLKITATDSTRHISSSVTMTVQDKTAPAAPTINKVTSKLAYVTGTSEKGATVYIYKGKTYLGKAVVSPKGTFKVKIKVQKKGSNLTVYAKDHANNQSSKRSVKVY